jgi:hypothetical protein
MTWTSEGNNRARYFYHMYNRGINSCSIFQNEQNQLFFLSKLSHYLNEICEVYTYCSMQHHFLLVKIKSKKFTNFAENAQNRRLQRVRVTSFTNVFSKRMDKLISRYNQSHTKENNRRVNLVLI